MFFLYDVSIYASTSYMPLFHNMYACMYACMYGWIHTCMDACMYVCMIHGNMYVCLVCMYASISYMPLVYNIYVPLVQICMYVIMYATYVGMYVTCT